MYQSLADADVTVSTADRRPGRSAVEKQVEDADEMALDTRSTKTVRAEK